MYQSSRNVLLGEEQLVTVGKWSSNMILLDLPVSNDMNVSSVTLALTELEHNFHSNWELHVYECLGSLFYFWKSRRSQCIARNPISVSSVLPRSLSGTSVGMETLRQLLGAQLEYGSRGRVALALALE